MEAKELNRLLIDRFPELEKKYHDEVDWQEGNETGSHVVYGDVLAPYLEAAVAQNKQEVLKKMFVFVEDILCQMKIILMKLLCLACWKGYYMTKNKFKIVESILENAQKR